MGNGEGLSISHIGFGHIRSNYTDKSLILNYLHFQRLLKIFSVFPSFAGIIVFFQFNSNTCYVVPQDTKRVLLQGILKDGLYYFPALQTYTNDSANTFSFTTNIVTINM